MFGTSGIRGEVGSEVTAELAQAVGRAVASEGYETVVVGRDTRETGSLLADAVCTGLRSCGADTVRVGVASTPTIARSVGQFDADAGVAVTASHNPPKDNGLKLWLPSGQAFDEPRRESVAKRVHTETYDRVDWRDVGEKSRREDVRERHRALLREAVDVDGDLSVVVDAANGPGRITADVMQELGVEVTTINGQPDGRYPGRPSEPTEEHCDDLSRMVAATDADLGIAHDGDADRTMAVTEDGEFVPGDVLLALFGRAFAEDGEEVAAPLNVSLAVDDALDEEGVSLTRTRVGDVYVAEEVSDEGVAFGGEPSGAWIWPDETLCPDGPLAACRLAELVSGDRSLSELVDDVEQYPMERTSVSVSNKQAVMASVERQVREEYDDVETTDGVRVATDHGWFLVRASGTQPLVRVTAEARERARMDDLLDRAVGYVEATTPVR